MNDIPTVFSLFFAIFLGTVANVQPRWKAFNWPLYGPVPKARKRAKWSIFFLSVLPGVYFALVFVMLKYTPTTTILPFEVLQVAVNGVLPAFGAFAFYRLWLGFVELHHLDFYEEYPCDLRVEFQKAEPTVAELWYPNRYVKNDNNSNASSPKLCDASDCCTSCDLKEGQECRRYHKVDILSGRSNITTALVYLLLPLLPAVVSALVYLIRALLPTLGLWSYFDPVGLAYLCVCVGSAVGVGAWKCWKCWKRCAWRRRRRAAIPRDNLISKEQM